MQSALDWWNLANGSLRASRILRDHDACRASASRSYYAAYQAITATLLAEKQVPPVVDGIQREAWNHTLTPKLFCDVGRTDTSTHRRRRMARELIRLYQVRVDADYSSKNTFTKQSADAALREAGRITKFAGELLLRA